MPHRTADPDRLHLARRPSHITDHHADATVNAYEAITRGDYKRDRREHQRPVGEDFASRTPERVQADLANSLLIPSAVKIACPVCYIPAGAMCWDGAARGVHIQRVLTAVHRKARAA